MSEEQQHQKEIMHTGEKAASAIQNAIISSVILRRPRVNIQIKTAEDAMKFAREGIKKRPPLM